MTTHTHYEITERARTEVTIQVGVGAEEIRKQMDDVYRRYAREVRIPGFRQGRVPRAYMDSRFGHDMFVEETKDDLQRAYFEKALDELAVRPVSVPSLETVSFDEAEGFVFRATFAVLPEIEVPEYEGLEITAPALKDITDDDVAAALEELRTEFATLEEKEGDAVKEGDIVRVKENEQEWDARADAENPVTKGLIGAAVGESVSIDTEVSEGRKIKTQLQVVGLRQVVLPALDDELAKDAGFESLDALRENVRTKMAEHRTEGYRRYVDGRLLDALVEKTDIPLPEAFINDLVDDELEELKKSLEGPRSSMTYEEFLEKRETTEEALRGDLSESISLRVRRELILSRLAESENIAFTEEELAALAQADAEEQGEDPLRFVARLKAEDRWSDYRTSKVNRELFERLRAAAVVKEEEE